MPDGILAKDVKFLGVVASYNNEKKFGMVASDEATAMWGQEIYAFKDVLASCGAQVGDTIRFGIHVNTRGQPQVSLPVWKVDESGFPIGIVEGNIVNAEEAVAQDPMFLQKLKDEIEGRSAAQNQKRAAITGNGFTGNIFGPVVKKGKFGKGTGGENFAWGCGGGGPAAWGKGMGGMGMGMGKAMGGMGMGGGMGAMWNPEVTLFVGGMPADVTQREVSHIFRQYAGFTNLRLQQRPDHSIAFVTFATMEQAQFVAQALNGYVFDEEAVPPQILQIKPAKSAGAGW